MTSTLPEDPYHALGLTKDATAASIKTAYRKLVLKHHPDKVQDEGLKIAAADLFHKIQAAWETIGDEEKRTRYDAQARLATLRKEAMERDRSGRDARQPLPTYREERSYDSRDASRGTPYRTEEVRPFETDYFDKSRREHDTYDRSRHTPPRDDRRSKLTRQDSKESERARRQEKVRQSTKATARERDYKHAQVEVESDSDSDRQRRSPHGRERERERERYEEQVRRQQEEAAYTRFHDERTKQKSADARDYIERSTRRRPSPTRMSSRDQDFMRDTEGRPVAFRRGSGRPKTSSRDDMDPKPRRQMERSSSELEDSSRRPPNLAHTKSAPTEIRLPYEKTRAASVQHTRAEMGDFLPTPVKRADSMPLQASVRSKPVRQSTLRQTQTSEDLDRHRPPPPGRSKEYLDDYEVPTPDGYVLENRRPARRTQSPDSYRRRGSTPEALRSGRANSPQRERREPSPEKYIRPPRTQSPSAMPNSNYRRHASSATPILPPLNTRTTSTSYLYSPQSGLEPVSASRPKLSRGESGRKDSRLYGEIPVSREPHSAPVPENARYRELRPDPKMQSGYSSARRPSEVRSPAYARGSSFNATPPMSA